MEIQKKVTDIDNWIGGRLIFTERSKLELHFKKEFRGLKQLIWLKTLN